MLVISISEVWWVLRFKVSLKTPQPCEHVYELCAWSNLSSVLSRISFRWIADQRTFAPLGQSPWFSSVITEHSSKYTFILEYDENIWVFYFRYFLLMHHMSELVEKQVSCKCKHDFSSLYLTLTPLPDKWMWCLFNQVQAEPDVHLF